MNDLSAPDAGFFFSLLQLRNSPIGKNGFVSRIGVIHRDRAVASPRTSAYEVGFCNGFVEHWSVHIWGLLVDYTATNNCTSYQGTEVRAAGNADNSLLIRVNPFVSLYHPAFHFPCAFLFDSPLLGTIPDYYTTPIPPGYPLNNIAIYTPNREHRDDQPAKSSYWLAMDMYWRFYGLGHSV